MVGAASPIGLSNYDQKLIDVTSVVYELPFGKSRRFAGNAPSYVDHAIGGWQISAINNALTGEPLNLRAWAGSIPAAFQVVGNLSGFRGGETYRPNLLGQALADDGVRNTDNYFNKSNVVLPTDPSHPFGNAGRNSVRGLPLNQLDIGVRRSFTFHDRFTIKAEAQIFNVINSNVATAESQTLGSSVTPYLKDGAGGVPTAILNPRMLRLAVQFKF